ncbi:bifunctional prephenate dehydrogenase/3-phosphoshikimate 1-carboxyvinyltransferase [Alkalimarinus alittae]|uniref:3-phosphoshikimate 1-carboxyvinyltransferase n=1 Tax=Alkalimarinus alittae TaxID=2961619 RepID=A0ABY6MYG2_9ALTE|nr:bifunctional prephenate dehydrogenase/3-phosphoshikimate 1-carboxyvinyltransferase [Alkalimarinus alittae]UZE94878.1 bifunctional prephenate dehydrogenase/3-phosphoshikimate 1-carboxyvinyltransferase [Alkalimarinus alittae]
MSDSTIPASVEIVDTVSVIGLGLIGGSFAKALKENGAARRVVGFDRSPDELTLGLSMGVIDDAASSLKQAVECADVVVLAVPVRAVEAVLTDVKRCFKENAILTDVGSVKGSFVKAVENVFADIAPEDRPIIVPGHPIAGSEKSGVAAANSSLFSNHKVILTPLSERNPQAVAQISAMWSSCGATVLEMGVDHHDDVLAATSHLPHLIAFSLVDTLAGEGDSKEIFKYAAGGFRDFTRIAASDPVMWSDIFLSNSASTLKVLDHFADDLAALRDAIANQDSKTLLGVFTRAKAARDHFSRILSGQAYTTIMNTKNVIFKMKPGGEVKGVIRVAGDKSMSHRSIMLGSLADGVTEVEGFLEGEDSLATLQAFRDMGVVIEGPDEGRVKIYGVGVNGLKQPPGPIYLGNSGTGMRLFAGLLAGQTFDTELTGDASLSTRPMERVAAPLRLMGAVIETGDQGRPPMKIKGSSPLKGMHYDMPMASAQVKSCLLLAGIYAEGETSVTEPAPTRDHTERMLNGFGYPVRREGATASLVGGGSLKATKIDVPADISSAAFFMVAASITPGAHLTLKHVGMNPTRVGIINILRAMGGKIEVSNESIVGGEPVADLTVSYSPLKGINIPEDQVPLAIDEFPVLFIAAVCAEGKTVLTGAEELRVKESDRIQVMADGLKALGVETLVTPDGIEIEGSEIGGGSVYSHGDHRIAMSFAVASLRAKGEIIINDCANVATSFPNFEALAKQVGMQISVEHE